jgi:hypothetical protein
MLRMRFYLSFLILSSFLAAKSQTTLSFTVINSSPSYSITCSNTSIPLSLVSNYTTSTVSYSWTNGTSSFSGANATLTQPGAYSITASTSNSITVTQTLSIGINTIAPTSIVNPTFQTINCTTLTPQSVTLSVTNPSMNVTNMILSPLGGSVISNLSTNIYSASAMGEYTCLSVNDETGCASVKHFTINSTQGKPIFNLISSPANFTLGCSTKSILTITPLGAQTTTIDASGNQVPLGGPVSFSLFPLGSSSFTGIGLPNPTVYTVTTGGNWLAIVKDHVSGCETRIPFSILHNTINPTLDSLIIPYTILTCEHPNTVLKGISKNSHVNYTWSYTNNIGIPTTILSNTISVQTITSSPTKTLIGAYIFELTDNSNACKTSTQITIFQNIFPPKAIIGSTGTCVPPAIVLSNISTTGIPASMPFPTIGVVADLWESPAPQPTLQLSNTYTASTPGQYFLTALDKSNGCKSKTNVELSLCVSLPEHLNTSVNIFSIYPNPTNASFIISLNDYTGQDYTIEVLNLIGKAIQVHNFSNTANNLNFSVENLPTGIYFVRATSGEKVMTKKVVVN